jgi:radical SAM protein with 4Fe4S-binding SPASM domain
MPTKNIIDLLDQAAALGFEGLVSFFYYSEPFADERALVLGEYARERGMKPYAHTNGDYFRNNPAILRAADNLFEYIVVGIYDYLDNKQLNAEKKFWKDKFRVTDLRFSTIGKVSAKSAVSNGIPKAHAPSDSRFIIPDLTYENGPCSQPTMRMIIRHDGRMVNCCEDIHGSFNSGNVHKNSIEELWFSDEHQKIVKNLLAGNRQKYALCKRCPLPPSTIPADGKPISYAPRKNLIQVS